MLAMGLSSMDAPAQAVIPNNMLGLLEQQRTIMQGYISAQHVANFIICFKNVGLEGKILLEKCCRKSRKLN